MNEQWQQFIQSQGAVINADNINWPEAALTADCALTDLSQLGLIKATGEDTINFLQGQLSNDIQLLDEQNNQLAAYCTSKGRMLAIMRLFLIGDDIYLQLPRERLAEILKRLSMFVMRSKVTLTDVSNELIAIGLSGDCINEIIIDETIKVISISTPTPRTIAIGNFDDIKSLWILAKESATLVNENFWPLLDIHAGIPSVTTATVEAFVPQMTNLQLLNGISFTKGCYTGQEIVARMHYLGQLKRRMFRAHAAAESVQAGDDLFAASNASGQGAGKVVDARPAPEGGWDILIVTPIKNIETNDLQLTDENGPRLSIKSLPYAFEDTDKNDKQPKA